MAWINCKTCGALVSDEPPPGLEAARERLGLAKPKRRLCDKCLFTALLTMTDEDEADRGQEGGG